MTQEQESKFGFTNFAETWNGRLAMLGFAIGLATELLTGNGILQQLGLM
ncbi:MAG: high light inducible protein [Moorea sp. SIO1F2]|uniref:High light inducible protein n=2 Tax=Moorena TaxID=1155738 RepID=A0A1D8TVG5_9CYAN|nr:MULTISPECIES: chlorophyll a/b-binding protein [Moorena]NEN98621.1 high light inducible protein [Moorena sp. SIO3I7]NEO50716.1 high light inducible protein [Moorena sp. SIO4A3]NEO66247.1 high light inducible protein [Moorena sp. SIO4G2]NEO89442.1 high light inducible protein [Moorena sp. SIO3G5]NEQ81214.1 high light inducible protein [Moorena sp. SIO2I5]